MTPTMPVFVYIGWFCLVATVSCQIMPISAEHVALAQHPVLPVLGKSNIFPLPPNRSPCRDGMCGGVSYNEILQQYKGLFFTEAELNYTQQIQGKAIIRWSWDKIQYAKSASKIQLKSGHKDHDGDKCCPTTCDHMCPEKMMNTRGQLRWIVHFEDLKPEPKYQLIPRGQCTNGGRCKRCVQEYAIHNILVVDESLLGYSKFPFEFDSFKLKSYCSCKRY